MIKLLKKKNNDLLINKYYYSRFSKKNIKFSISKKIDIINHYNWWFNNKRNFYFYQTKNKKNFYFWSEINFFKKKSYCTCGFHLDDKINILDVIIIYKKFLKLLKKKYKFPIIGVTEKKNLFLIKINENLGFKKIINKKSSQYIFLKKKYNLKKNSNNYIFFYMKN
tara:strand:- start:35 stop:532 length:498 start_codon:yes stop_codon:yes gene_type:complete